MGKRRVEESPEGMTEEEGGRGSCPKGRDYLGCLFVYGRWNFCFGRNWG